MTTAMVTDHVVGAAMLGGVHGVVKRDTTQKRAVKTYFRESDFRHETHLLKLLEGVPGIVQLVSSDELTHSAVMQDGGVALVDLVSVGPLKDWIDLHFQIITAIGLLHARNIVHGDIKPDNILVDHDRVVRLCDFGHSRILEVHEKHSATLLRKRGTLRYACPEIMAGVAYDGFAADAWSAGIVLVAMTCGLCPFAEASLQCPRYAAFREAVVRRGKSPSEALVGLVPPDWRIDAMRTPLFTQNLDFLLHPLPEHRINLEAD